MRRRTWLGFGVFGGAEVGRSDLETVDKDGGAFQVHFVGGDADDDVGDCSLD